MKYHSIEGINQEQLAEEGLAKEPLIALPSNIVLAASHAPREIPQPKIDMGEGISDEAFIISDALSTNEAIRRDYSDYATGLIQDWFDPKQTVSPRYGRIAGDPNRPIHQKGDKGVHRSTTMGGNIKLWKDAQEPEALTKAIWLDESHRSYYEQIFAKILTALDETREEHEEDPDIPLKPVIFVDHHDTGDARFTPEGGLIEPSPRLESFGRKVFYSAVVSDLEGDTSGVTDAFIKILTSIYNGAGIRTDDTEIDVNGYYKGGNVVRYVGLEIPKILKEWGREEDASRIHAIQLETPRNRTLADEETQVMDLRKVHNEAVLLGQILTATSVVLNPVAS